MTREIIRAESSSIKLGVIDSQIASVRTQTEQQTAVRVIEHGNIGVASACGRADVESLTRLARESLVFAIGFDAEPEQDRSLSVSHMGDHHDVASLVEVAEQVLASLHDEFPGFVFSHGVEQDRLAWHIESSAGLDLHYERINTQVAFIAKEKGSGNIIDTFVGVAGPELNVDGILGEFRTHLAAYSNTVPAKTGRQRVIFPGLEGMAGSGLFQLFRTDLLARTYASGTSLFHGMVGDGLGHFNPALHLFESRDPDLARVCPFDMEGVVRSPINLDIIRDGQLRSIAANKRDASRYGVPATGTAVGDVAQLPVSGFGCLGATPTAPRLADLIDERGALLVWFVAGGDSTRTGDMALPAQVMLSVDGDGCPIGRVPGATLTGNIFDVFGGDFVGVTEETVDPFGDERFLVTHMDVQV
jgi:PmbA protein